MQKFKIGNFLSHWRHCNGPQSKQKMKRTREPDVLEWAELVLPYLQPPDLAAVAATCRSLRRLSLSITARRSADASRGFEKHPVPFLNTVGPHRYAYFLYIPSSSFTSQLLAQSWGGSSSQPPPRPASSHSDFTIGSGCECEDCSGDPKGCPCSLSPETLELRRECGSNCRCGSDCGNRSTQKGVGVQLKIIRDSKKGWGLHSAQSIKKGEFICEYAGILFIHLSIVTCSFFIFFDATLTTTNNPSCMFLLNCYI